MQKNYVLPKKTWAWLIRDTTAPTAQWAVSRVEWAVLKHRPIEAKRISWEQAQLLVLASSLRAQAREPAGRIRARIAAAAAMGFLD